jgi:hypothetical protein
MIGVCVACVFKESRAGFAFRNHKWASLLKASTAEERHERFQDQVPDQAPRTESVTRTWRRTSLISFTVQGFRITASKPYSAKWDMTGASE